MSEYDKLQKRLAQGWNTWNTRSVLSHVLLPEGFALNLGLKEYSQGSGYLKEALIGRKNKGEEQVRPGYRSYDGYYTELNLKWRGIELDVQSAVMGDDLVLLITPIVNQAYPATLVVEAGILWNRTGYMIHTPEGLQARFTDEKLVTVYATGNVVYDPYIIAQAPYLQRSLDGPVGVSTGKNRSLEEIKEIIAAHRSEHIARVQSFGDLSEVYTAIQSCLAWDTIYEPEHSRVVSPVSRIWNTGMWGGYVLFDWDTYFAAYMAAIDNKDLAYANAVEITREITESGFIPNFGAASNIKSRDRSEPPVGALVVGEIYRRFGDRWFLEEVFQDLLTWNRWWATHRMKDRYLCWGSDPFTPLHGANLEKNEVNAWQGGAWESGLDNSPMFDDIPFDPSPHLLLLADIGLMSLYVRDCIALSEIAQIIERPSEAFELKQRAEKITHSIQSLWDDKTGLFLNRRLDDGRLCYRLSPTHFYPLLAQAASREQAQRMIDEHFYNPDEFWGEWIIPNIARNDSAFKDQEYWRGRIWGPTNFLVYLGLRSYDLSKARIDLVEKSKQLMLKEWQEKGHVHENYNAITGEGCDVRSSDAYYHWGGLLGLMAFIENGILPAPEGSLLGLVS